MKKFISDIVGRTVKTAEYDDESQADPRVTIVFTDDMRMNWRVEVYDGEAIVGRWKIMNRTEQQATKEAMHEVERQYPGLDWTIKETS